jgi:hypothetical protein
MKVLVTTIAACCLFVALASPAFAEDDMSYAGNADDAGNVAITGSNQSSSSSNSSAPAEANGFAPATVTVVEIETRCGDAIQCAADHALYCADRPRDDPQSQWRVVRIETYDIADTARLTPISGTIGCQNFGALAEAGPSAAQVREVLITAIPVSGAGTSPAPGGSGVAEFVVNLPLIVFATGPVEIAPGPEMLVGHEVEVSAAAVTYEWRVDGAAPVVTDSPGSPFDASRPCGRDSCDGYAQVGPFHSTGRHEVELTVTWAGRYRVDGGPWIAIDAPIGKTSPPAIVNVREARAVLVGR